MYKLLCDQLLDSGVVRRSDILYVYIRVLDTAVYRVNARVMQQTVQLRVIDAVRNSDR
jgi:hypothetical protein